MTREMEAIIMKLIKSRILTCQTVHDDGGELVTDVFVNSGTGPFFYLGQIKHAAPEYVWYGDEKRFSLERLLRFIKLIKGNKIRYDPIDEEIQITDRIGESLDSESNIIYSYLLYTPLLHVYIIYQISKKNSVYDNGVRGIIQLADDNYRHIMRIRNTHKRKDESTADYIIRLYDSSESLLLIK